MHSSLRRVMNPYLVPQAIEGMRPLMEAATTWFLDERIESGSIDLVLDLANPVPAILTMALVGLPLDGWRPYAELFHGTIAHRPGEPEFDRAVASVPGDAGPPRRGGRRPPGRPGRRPARRGWSRWRSRAAGG